MQTRTFEVFTGDCPACDEKVQEIKAAACPACEVVVLPISKSSDRAKALGVKGAPAVAINGQLAACCETGRVDIDRLRSLGLGVEAA